MKKIFFFLVFLAFLDKTQSHRFIYEYTYKSDSLNRNMVSTELMRLNITPDFSEFFSEKKAKADSVILKNLSINKDFEYDFSMNVSSRECFKDYKKDETKLLCDIGIQQYYVKMSEKPEWKLSSDIKKIGPFICQKASTNYGGRFWTAWFTADLPFQEGPYIFKNLPGLVVEVFDSKNDHHFLLVKNYNVSDFKSGNYSIKEILNIDPAHYKTQWLKYKENPIPVMLQMKELFIAENSAESAAKQSREIEGIKKQIMKNNNPILLTLYK